MGFFKDFKDDLSQAVNELVPGEDALAASGSDKDLLVNTLQGEVDIASEMSKLDGLLEQVTKKTEVKPQQAAVNKTAVNKTPVNKAAAPAAEGLAANWKAAASESMNTKWKMPAAQEKTAVNQKAAAVSGNTIMQTIQEEKKMADNLFTAPSAAPAAPAPAAAPTAVPVNTQLAAAQEKPVSDEMSVITEGMVIHGDVITNGSLDVRGQVDGNINCNGKLSVTGVVNGNSNTSEFFADSAQVAGEIMSTGTVKIGIGSVIIGNITASSAVIAGAIKGDIDVQGPVVVDTSAVVMGNIKSRSVQINNGAVIEGFCSQCYAEVDVQGLFDAKKGM